MKQITSADLHQRLKSFLQASMSLLTASMLFLVQLTIRAFKRLSALFKSHPAPFFVIFVVLWLGLYAQCTSRYRHIADSYQHENYLLELQIDSLRTLGTFSEGCQRAKLEHQTPAPQPIVKPRHRTHRAVLKDTIR